MQAGRLRYVAQASRLYERFSWLSQHSSHANRTWVRGEEIPADLSKLSRQSSPRERRRPRSSSYLPAWKSPTEICNSTGFGVFTLTNP